MMLRGSCLVLVVLVVAQLVSPVAVLALQELELGSTSIVYASDLWGDWAPGGDFYEGLLWLASPEYTSIPDLACWVTVTATSASEHCVGSIDGIPVAVEDVRADWGHGRLWAVARYDTSWTPSGGSYILEWAGNGWRIAATISNQRWGVYRADTLLMDITSDGRVVALVYLRDANRNPVDIRLVIYDPSTGELSDLSIGRFGLATDLPPWLHSPAVLAVHGKHLLIGTVKRVSETRIRVQLAAVSLLTLSHKKLVDDIVDASSAFFIVLREPGRPQSYLALVVLGPGSRLAIRVYDDKGLVASREYVLPIPLEKWAAPARVSLLAEGKYFYLALSIYNATSQLYDLYLIGDGKAWRVWSAPALWGGVIAYAKQWGIVALGPSQHPWKWGTGRIILAKDPGTPLSLAPEEQPPPQQQTVNLTIRVHLPRSQQAGGAIVVVLNDLVRKTITQSYARYTGAEEHVDIVFTGIKPSEYLVRVYNRPNQALIPLEYWGETRIEVTNTTIVDFTKTTPTITTATIDYNPEKQALTVKATLQAHQAPDATSYRPLLRIVVDDDKAKPFTIVRDVAPSGPQRSNNYYTYTVEAEIKLPQRLAEKNTVHVYLAVIIDPQRGLASDNLGWLTTPLEKQPPTTPNATEELLAFFNTIEAFYEEELNMLKDAIAETLSALRIQEDLDTIIEKYLEGSITEDLAAAMIANLVLAATAKIGEKIGATIVSPLIAAAQIAEGVAELAKIGSNETRLEMLAALIVKLLATGGNSTLVPLPHCLETISIKTAGDRVVLDLEYSQTCIKNTVARTIGSLNETELEALLQVATTLQHNIHELHNYPLLASVTPERLKALAETIDQWFSVTIALTTAFTVAAAIVAAKFPPFIVVSIILGSLLEAKKEEAKREALQLTLLIAYHSLIKRHSYIRVYYTNLLTLEGAYSIATPTEIQEHIHRLETLLSGKDEIHVPGTSIDYNCVIAPVDNTIPFYTAKPTYQDIISSTTTFENHQVYLVCEFGVHRIAKLVFHQKPRVHLKELGYRIQFLPPKIIVYATLQVTNPYNQDVKVRTITYPDTFGIPLAPLQTSETTLPANTTTETTITLLEIVTLNPALILPIPYTTKLYINNAEVLSISLTTILGEILGILEAKEQKQANTKTPT